MGWRTITPEEAELFWSYGVSVRYQCSAWHDKRWHIFPVGDLVWSPVKYVEKCIPFVVKFKVKPEGA